MQDLTPFFNAGFTTVRNLGLFVKTGGYLLDVALMQATDAGWIEGPRIVPCGHAIAPTGGHLEPSALGGFAPGIMPLSIAVAGDPLQNIEQIREVRFVMKDGRIHKHPDLLDA